MTEREARERAAIKVLIEGLPDSPGGVGPVIRLLQKQRQKKELAKQKPLIPVTKDAQISVRDLYKFRELRPSDFSR